MAEVSKNQPPKSISPKAFQVSELENILQLTARNTKRQIKQTTYNNTILMTKHNGVVNKFLFSFTLLIFIVSYNWQN